MGVVVKFHARASARAGGFHEASCSKVMWLKPRSEASRTKSDQRRGGIPRVRQELTVEAGKPSSALTAPVPPRSSIAASGVSMGANIVRTVRTSQEFADRETTPDDDCGSLGTMIDEPEIIGPRLRALRIALGFHTQVAFATKLGIEKNTYNPFEKGTRPLTFEVACTIRRKFKIPVDYLFWGDSEDQLPAGILRKIERAA